LFLMKLSPLCKLLILLTRKDLLVMKLSPL
jgi:hypothetical protein